MKYRINKTIISVSFKGTMQDEYILPWVDVVMNRIFMSNGNFISKDRISQFGHDTLFYCTFFRFGRVSRKECKYIFRMANILANTLGVDIEVSIGNKTYIIISENNDNEESI